MGKVSIHNYDKLIEAADLLKDVFLEDIDDLDEGIRKEVKFFNFENLSHRAWKKRFKDKNSPHMEISLSKKYNQEFISINIFNKIEDVEILIVE